MAYLHVVLHPERGVLLLELIMRHLHRIYHRCRQTPHRHREARPEPPGATTPMYDARRLPRARSWLPLHRPPIGSLSPMPTRSGGNRATGGWARPRQRLLATWCEPSPGREPRRLHRPLQLPLQPCCRCMHGEGRRPGGCHGGDLGDDMDEFRNSLAVTGFFRLMSPRRSTAERSTETAHHSAQAPNRM